MSVQTGLDLPGNIGLGKRWEKCLRLSDNAGIRIRGSREVSAMRKGNGNSKEDVHEIDACSTK